MKIALKIALLRGLFGAPMGIAVGQIIALIVSACIGDGGFHAVAPELVTEYGTEFSASLMTSLLSAILGFAFAAASIIFQFENWSILKQTLVHFLITATVYAVVAYFLFWCERSLAGIVSTMVVFLGIYICIWLGQYLGNYYKIKAINKKLSEQ